MNRSGVLQSSPVQQMIAGSPNWWSINGGAAIRPPSSHHHHHHHHHHQQLISSPFFPPPPASPFFSQFSPSSSSSSNWHDHQNNQDLPESWSQLLMGGLVGEEDKCGGMESFHQQTSTGSIVEVKQESSGNGSYVYGNEQASWSHHHHQMMPLVSSPNKSCVTATTFSSTNNMLDFSGTTSKGGGADARHPPPPLDRSSSECNSPASGGALKKARVQPSASQSTFKVRKEKLGDRITALHQLVSPFGKTDTASVLLEAIGYIRFLQSQIEALSMPYLGSGSGNIRHQQSAVQGERNSMFPEDPGQLLNTSSMKRKGGPDQECGEEGKKDLRSRGLCLVPVSCTLQVGSDNGADYWAPATLGPNAGFR